MTKSRSVLSRQKPKKGRKKARKSLLRQAGLVLGAAAVLALVLVAYNAARRTPASTAARAPRPIDWKVSIKLDGDKPLPDADVAEIVEIARKTLGDGQRRQLNKTAAAIQRLDAYSSVHVLRLAHDQAAVQVSLRVPELCIAADKLRLVAEDGSVYGATDACPHPVLAGVFDDQKAPLTLAADFTLSLNESEKAAVAEALELQREGRKRGLALAAMDYRKYRGFFVKLAGQDLEIAMGRAPFAVKLDKLRDILDKLAAKGEQAARIELDYQGKAFVKLKKL